MELYVNIISIVWTAVAILAGILLSLSFHLFRKKRNSSRNDVSGNGNDVTPIETAATSSVVHPLSQNYEVFLNFRGEDTRKTFTDHLYHRLIDARVCVFRDNEELHVGEEIHPNLLAAIQTSKISIAIISPNYAYSKWCLRELVQILKSRETMGQVVIPIFYHVDPSDVRHQTGSFGKGFSLQKKKHSTKVIQEWKEALEKVASLKVLELNNNADGYEGKLGKQVVEMVLTVLNKTTLVVPEYLVGVEKQVKKIMEMIDLQSPNDVQVLLIHGMGGIGKTALAKFLYNQLSKHFYCCSFLENVRETSMQQLQKQLISNILKGKLKGMKILVVFDDVDHRDQVNALVGRYDWLGLGSIMIITTRNRDVLNPWHVKLTYELKELDFDQSFQLFCKHALQRRDSHFGEFETIARDIVSTTGGLPLAIEVISSLLSGKDLDFWMETLKKLRRIPNESVLLKLQISFEALTYEQKQIFLDISCLYSLKEELASFMYMWDDCSYYPRSEIEVLKSLCLIKVRYGNQLTMHDQLRLLGREIVRQESDYQLERCRILWNQEEALEVMEMNQGTEQIEALNLALDRRSEENCFTSEQFERLKKLRVLQLKNANLVGDFKNRFLSLRWFQWYGCPSNFMATSFRPKNLVILNLSFSLITEDWGGWSEIKYAGKLKVLKLRFCSQLKATPDFSAFKELEILDLYGCRRLSRIHPSICKLTKTLKTLHVGRCKELEELPKEIGNMEELRMLSLDETSIREIPIAEGFMTKLENLSASNCKKLARLPESIGSLTRLKSLDMNECVSLTIIPESIGKLESLSSLILGNTNITKLPDSIRNLHNLVQLDVARAHGLTELPSEIGELTSLESLILEGTPMSRLSNLPDCLSQMIFSGSSMESLPSLSYLCNLDWLRLKDMGVIPDLELPSIVQTLHLHASQTLSVLPNFSYLNLLSILEITDWTELIEINALEEVRSLRELKISGCRKISELSGVRNSLTSLWLKSCDGLKSLPNLSTFKNLTTFGVVECNNIVEIRGLDTIKCLKVLAIHDCSSLERVGGFSRLTATLRSLLFGNCPKLRDIDYPCINKFTSLEQLCLFGGIPMMKFPDLPKLRNLRRLGVNNFGDLREIPKLQELKSLRILNIGGSKSLENLPDFSEFTKLGVLYAQGCDKLTEFRGLEKLNFFNRLYIFGCTSLRQLPDLPDGSIYKQNSRRVL